MARKNKNNYGEGCWDTTLINGIEYIRFRKIYDGMTKPKSFYGKTKKEIKEKVNKFEKEKGLKPSAKIEKMILYDYINDWLYNVKRKSVKENTFDTLCDTLKYYIAPYDIATMQMAKLNSSIIQEHYNLMAEKYSMSVIKKVHSMLGMIFKYAIIKKDIFDNPLFAVELPSKDNVKPSKEIEILDDEDIEKLYQEATRLNTTSFSINGKVDSPIYRGNNKYIIILLLYTGMRIGEALALQWKDYSKSEKTLRIREDVVRVNTGQFDEKGRNIKKTVTNSTKTNAGIRLIKLSSRAIWAIEQLEKNKCSDNICVTVNGKLPSESTITRTLHSMVTRAELKVNPNTFGLHDLRHTFASYQIRHGTDIIVVASLIGHKSPETTMKIYAHVIEEQRIKAIEIFDSEAENNTEE